MVVPWASKFNLDKYGRYIFFVLLNKLFLSSQARFESAMWRNLARCAISTQPIDGADNMQLIHKLT